MKKHIRTSRSSGGFVMKKHIRTGIAAVAGLTLIVFSLAGQASASHTVCNDNEFCDWKHTGFNIGDPDNRCWNTNHNRIDNYINFNWIDCDTGNTLGDNLNDDTSSARNEFNTTTVRLCRNANGGTPCTSFGPNTQSANLSFQSVGNDQASSHRP